MDPFWLIIVFHQITNIIWVCAAFWGDEAEEFAVLFLIQHDLQLLDDNDKHREVSCFN